MVSAIVAACAALGGAGHAIAALPAFPGAEGFAANATGGRGGDVYHVTTLADDPNHVIRGSLFYGLYEKSVPAGGRTIVFDVGGTINLGAVALDIKNVSNVTIAGHTAPSPITIVGNTLQITGSSGRQTSNIILQHINLRKGTAAGEDALSIKGSGSTHNIIVDHVSGSWSEDEVISVTQGANNVTVQNSTLSEALTSNHAYGALIRPTVDSNVSYNRNLFSNQRSRSPRPGSYDGATLNFEFQNNVIYNWSDRAGYIAGADINVQIMNMNYAGNYLIAGPVASSSAAMRRETAFYKENNSHPLAISVHQAGNRIDSNSNTLRDGTDTGWGMFKQLTNGALSNWAEADKAAGRFNFPAGLPDTAEVAYAKIIGQVGAFPWARSATDQRLVNDVINYTGFAPIDAPPSSEWNAIVNAPITTRAAGFDEENNGNYLKVSWEDPNAPTNRPKPKGDGMPTWWELLRGYDPLAHDNNVLTAEGYTRLEKYLHAMAAQANWNLNADGNWSQHMNWRGMRPESRDAIVGFVPGITAPRSVNLDIPATVGQMSFSSPIGYTLEGPNALTIDVISGRALVEVTEGSHAITAPLVLADDVIVNVQQSGETLTSTNLQPAENVIITKNGLGSLAVNRVRAASLVVNEGKVTMLPDGSASTVGKIGSLVLVAGAKLDLSDNALVVSQPAGSWNGTAYTGIAGLVQAGRNEGAWDAPAGGIVTTDPRAVGAGASATIGVARVSDIRLIADTATTTFAGQVVLGSDTVAMFTYGGDANLDGKVNVDDYGRIDSNVASSGSVFGWSNGDFNYDGKINVDDYGIIDANISAQGAPFLTGGDPVLSQSTPSVPEAGCALWLLAPALLRLRRSR